MKKFYVVSWIVLLTGIIFKFIHFPGAGVLMSLSGLLLLIHSVIYLIKHAKSDLPTCFIYLSSAFITIYLIARLQYWAFARPLFPIVCLLVLAYFVIFTIYKSKFQLIQIILIFYFIFFWIISYTPSYKIYYCIYLNTLVNKSSRNVDYRSWDKYSWFLYLRNKQDEAIDANKNAQDAIELYLKNSNDDEAKQYLTIIKQHEQQIRDRTWTNY
jgi:hypothetical protein